jgi:hypothetical protein
VSFDFYRIHNTVSVLLRDALSLPWWSLSRMIEPIGEEACSATKQKLLANFEELIVPEFVLVQNVG